MCTIYKQLTDIYLDMDMLTSYRILPFILTSAGFTDMLKISIQGQIFGGCICRIVVDYPLSVLLLCQSILHTRCCALGPLNSDPLLPGYGIPNAMTCCDGRGEKDGNETMWEVLRNESHIVPGDCPRLVLATGSGNIPAVWFASQ